MDKTFKIMDKILKINLHSNYFDKDPRTKFQVFKIVFVYLITISFLVLCYHALIMDSSVDLHDKIYLACVTPTLTGFFMLMVYFSFKQENFFQCILWVKFLYVPENHQFNFDFTELSENIWKAFKFISGMQVAAYFFFLISPFIFDSMELSVPVWLPSTNASNPFYYGLNFIVQNFVILNLSGFMLCYMMFFVIFTGHLITQARFFHEILRSIGEKEEFINEKGNKKNVEPGTVIMVVPKDEDMEDSSIILKKVIVLHNQIMSMTEKTFELFSFGTLIWEYAMILVHGINCTLYFVLPDKIVPTFVGGLALTCHYFLLSFISTKVQEGNEEIADALYNSKWYALNVTEQKIVLQIIQMAQNAKTMKVGGFGECNLERFIRALNTTRKICLALQYFASTGKM